MPPAAPAAPPPEPDTAGWLLGGRYRVIDRIGSGGMAEVFRAHDELLARDVAIKVFRAHSDPADTAGGAQRQELELQTLARLSHPNLITLFDGSTGTSGEQAFLVMELINGPSLASRIAESPLTEPETREMAAQIAGALAYVHSQHMVHRDIKPANILLGSDSAVGDTTIRARLSDFGIVRLLGSEHLTSADFMVGTASYLAPEQARGAEVGPAADIYALGLVLIEALTGRRSYEGPALEAVLARLDRSPEIPANLSRPWPELLRSMTAMDPELRPSAVEVTRILRDGAAMPVVAGDALLPGGPVLAGDAVLAGGAPLAAASGLAGAAATAGFAAASGYAAAAGLAETPGAFAETPGAFAETPGAFAESAADPDLHTAFISAAPPPMPPPPTAAPEPVGDAPRRRRAGGPRGPLVAAGVAAAALVIAVTTGALALGSDSGQKGSALLPGQAGSSTVGRPSGGRPSSSATSLAPVGSVPTGVTSHTSARASTSATHSTPASSSAGPSSSAPAPSSSAPPTSSAPPSSSAAAATSSTPPPSSTASSTAAAPASSGTTTSPSPAGASKTSAGPQPH